MPIQLPSAPPEALAAVQQNVPRSLQASPPGSAFFAASAAPQGVNVSQPHRVFVASLDDVLSGNVLRNAAETAWRFFLMNAGDDAFATSEVTGSTVTQINEGPFVQGTASAMIAAEGLDAVRTRDYELRLLRIPALYTLAVWLTAPGDDILVPAAPATPPLVPNQPYNEAQFTAALLPLATKRKAVDETGG
jgi:hypothetical protein